MIQPGAGIKFIIEPRSSRGRSRGRSRGAPRPAAARRGRDHPGTARARVVAIDFSHMADVREAS